MTTVTASAPGRVNLIGEHTDYNGGFVLPTPIPQHTTVALTLRADRHVSVVSDGLPDPAAYELGTEARRAHWVDYVMGCTLALQRAGHVITGFDARIASDIPIGSGLSSSAALEVALLRALRTACHLELDDLTLALLAQRAETDLVGAPIGAMDQLCSSLGRPGAALFIDMTTLASRLVPLPATLDFVVIASGVGHDHATGDYRVRRAECEAAARALGVTSLRALGIDALPRLMALPAPLGARARHVITENARVLAAVTALEAADGPRLGELFQESHTSQRLDFAVSVPAIDALVAIATADPEVFGARLTGGGFGGSIVAVTPAGAGARAARRVTARYQVETGHTPQVLVSGPATGAAA